MKLFFLALAATCSTLAFASEAQAPEQIERASYTAWLNEIHSVISPFNEYLFDWYETQLRTPMPEGVAQDPEKIFVAIDAPLAETIELEDAGDIETGVTYGLETYALVDVDVNTAIEALLFKWGKPIGKPSGMTYPYDTVYGYRQEIGEPKWGASTFQTTTTKTGGGIAKDQKDIYSLMVRGDSSRGYVAVGQFLKPHGNTSTTASMSILMFLPTPDGKTEFRVSGRHMGQSYKFFGIEYGRRNFGFNKDRIRVGQKEFIDSMYELKRTGTIKERRPAFMCRFMPAFGC